MAVPFFVLMGIALNRGKSGNYLMDLANSLVGWFYGGLSAVMVVVNMFFGGCSGSAVADASSIGGVMIPEMIRKGYGKGYAAALNAASSTIGIIIPPSIPMILYAWVTEVSIRKLFLAGVIPGILVGLAQMIVAGFLGYRRKHYRAPRPSVAIVWPQLIKALPALFIPVIVMGGILAGIYTTTEAALMGAFYVIVIEMFYYKAFGLKDLFTMLVESAKVTGVVVLLIATSLMLTYVIVLSRVPHGPAGQPGQIHSQRAPGAPGHHRHPARHRVLSGSHPVAADLYPDFFPLCHQPGGRPRSTGGGHHHGPGHRPVHAAGGADPLHIGPGSRCPHRSGQSGYHVVPRGDRGGHPAGHFLSADDVCGWPQCNGTSRTV